MKLHLVQIASQVGNPKANRARVRELLGLVSASEPGLIILPELFSTGVAEPKDQERFTGAAQGDRAFFAELARESGCYVLGATVDGRADAWHNLSLLYDPSGLPCASYRKIHPFSLGGEDRIFSPGVEITVTPIGGFHMQQAICYDLRFPELFRAGIHKGANLIVLQAAWPATRAMHWEILLRARAIENQAIVAGVNVTGKQGILDHAGQSCIIHPRGDFLGKLDREEGVLTQDIQPETVLNWRRAFPALRDRRPSSIFRSCESA